MNDRDRELIAHLEAETKWASAECDRIDRWLSRVEAAGGYANDDERERLNAALAELRARNAASHRMLLRRTAN